MKTSNKIGTMVGVCAVVLCCAAGRVGAEEWRVMGNTVWTSGDARLTLEMPSASHPDLIVTSSEAGDLQWIHVTVPFVLGEKIKSVGLAYKTPDNGTYISQIRLMEYLIPGTSVVKYDDGTDLISVAGDVYFSHVDSYMPEGSVNLALRLNFANAGDEIHLGALAILFE